MEEGSDPIRFYAGKQTCFLGWFQRERGAWGRELHSNSACRHREEKEFLIPPTVNPEKTFKEKGASGSQQIGRQDPNTHRPHEVQGIPTATTAGQISKLDPEIYAELTVFHIDSWDSEGSLCSRPVFLGTW